MSTSGLISVILFVVVTITGMMLFAWILKLICIDPILNEMRKNNLGSQTIIGLQHSPEINMGNDPQINNNIAAKLEELKERRAKGEITDSQYAEEYLKIGQ